MDLPDIIIDLGGKLQVIDESSDPPRWRTIARVFPATPARAWALLADLPTHPRNVWLLDDLGCRTPLF